jgi:hypothetical protein
VLGGGLDLCLGGDRAGMQATDLEEIGLGEGGGSGKDDRGEFECLGGKPDRGAEKAEGKESRASKGEAHWNHDIAWKFQDKPDFSVESWALRVMREMLARWVRGGG